MKIIYWHHGIWKLGYRDPKDLCCTWKTKIKIILNSNWLQYIQFEGFAGIQLIWKALGKIKRTFWYNLERIWRLFSVRLIRMSKKHDFGFTTKKLYVEIQVRMSFYSGSIRLWKSYFFLLVLGHFKIRSYWSLCCYAYLVIHCHNRLGPFW